MSNGQIGGGPWQSQMGRTPATLDEIRALLEQCRAEMLENMKLMATPVWIANCEGPLDELDVGPGNLISSRSRVTKIRPAYKTREEAEAFAAQLFRTANDHVWVEARHGKTVRKKLAILYEDDMRDLIDFIYGKAE